MQDIQVLLAFLKDNGYKAINQEEDIVTFSNKKDPHLLRLSTSTATFSHPDHPGQEYSIGATIPVLRSFFRGGNPVFRHLDPNSVLSNSSNKQNKHKPMGQITDNKSVIDSTPAAAGIPETTPEVTTGATPESTPAPIKEKKPRAPKAPKAPGEKRVSALGTIRDLIKEGKTKEEILAIVTPMFPDRTPASLSGQVTSTISAQKKVQ